MRAIEPGIYKDMISGRKFLVKTDAIEWPGGANFVIFTEEVDGIIKYRVMSRHYFDETFLQDSKRVYRLQRIEKHNYVT